jgi:hypothetical protein
MRRQVGPLKNEIGPLEVLWIICGTSILAFVLWALNTTLGFAAHVAGVRGF